MATVGERLVAPEEGWRRFNVNSNDFSIKNFTYYTDTATGLYNNDTYYAVSGTVTFKFKGTKLRILGQIYYQASKSTQIAIDGTTYTYSEYNASVTSGVNTGQTVIFEKTGLTDDDHLVVITVESSGSNYSRLDAIDIDEDGYLVDLVVAPANLTATAGDSKVTLSWDAVDGATSYIIKRSTTSGGTYETIASGVTDTSYVDTSVTNGTTYYYVVTAVNDYGESDNSNEASATPVDSSKYLLRVTMLDSSEREYRLAIKKVEGFVNWYKRTLGTGDSCYELSDIVDNSKEYLAFEKIISFKVIPLNI